MITDKKLIVCRLNGGPFEEEKPLMSRDLEDEEAEDLGADEEEGEELRKPAGKPEGQSPPGNLSDDGAQEEMDFSKTNDLSLNCKTSPRRYISIQTIKTSLLNMNKKMMKV